MPGTNGHGLRRAVLYARVSTEEQVKSGYSLAQQMEALREYAAREGYEVLEEVSEPGQSGATLVRPGMDRVRDLVATGEVSVVLAQDRDRLVREPAYHYLLKREFEEYGCALRALNDRGDDSPEGQLAEGVLDQIAKYERLKMAERSRRGKLRKAREGKFIAGRMAKYGWAKYGFRLNEARDGLVVDEESMSVVRRIFYSIALEGRSLFAVKKALDAAGVPTATGKASWTQQAIRKYVLDDAYRPHTYQEISVLITPEVAARLDPKKRYGIWRFNTRRYWRTEVAVEGTDGRATYRRKVRYKARPEEEWIAVPIPDSGIPREWVDAARDAIKDNRKTSNAGLRFWELSGRIVRCGWCGHAMFPHTTSYRQRKYLYYCCRTKYKKGARECPKALNVPAVELEEKIWEVTTGILKHPEQLRANLDAMIEMERNNARGNAGEEAKLWADALAEVDRKRARYQEMAAADLITLEELRSRLTELEDTRRTAENELRILRNRQEHIEDSERDRDTLLDRLEGLAPEALDALTPEERHHFYKLLQLKVTANLDGSFEVTGVFEDDLCFFTLETSRR